MPFRATPFKGAAFASFATRACSGGDGTAGTMPGMTRRAPRPLVAGALALVISLASAGTALAADFTGIQAAAEPFSWNPGKSLATTTGHLVSAWASDCPPPTGACATDGSPTMRVFVQRAGAKTVPAVWGRPVRVSPLDAQAERVSLAADGDLVAVGWVTQRSYLHYDPAAPRVFWIRISTDRGRHWRRPHRMSLRRGRVDYPRLAVADGSIFAVWTNADTGEIRLASSSDTGATWTRGTVGTTTSRSDGWREGYAGLPDIGASGADVGIVWFGTSKGMTSAVFSSVGGGDLFASAGTSTTLAGASPNDGQRYAAAAGSPGDGDPRVAVAFTTNGQLIVRVWDGATLGGDIAVASFPSILAGATYSGAYGPAVLPVAVDDLVVAFAGCRARSGVPDPCDPTDPDARIDVLYTESPDGGTSWAPVQRVADGTTAPFRTNDEPSIALTSGTRRVAFDSYASTFEKYRVRMRSSL
jgi:hypothetical protein